MNPFLSGYFPVMSVAKKAIVEIFESITGIEAKGHLLEFLNLADFYLIFAVVIIFALVIVYNPKAIFKIMGFLVMAVLALFFFKLFGLL